MAIIWINGVEMAATPSDFQVAIMDISKAERNANGKMIIERVTTKRKLFLTFAFLTQDTAAAILRQIAPTFYDVTYIDPQLKTKETGSFYCGDRNIGWVDYQNGVPRYKELTFNLIER